MKLVVFNAFNHNSSTTLPISRVTEVGVMNLATSPMPLGVAHIKAKLEWPRNPWFLGVPMAGSNQSGNITGAI